MRFGKNILTKGKGKWSNVPTEISIHTALGFPCRPASAPWPGLPDRMARVDYLTWCQVLLGFWMTKHLYLTTMLLTLHGKGLEKVNVNIVCFLQTTQEYHIWWVTSP